nr:COR domain-containing protein [Plastoroseomonas arctica]
MKAPANEIIAYYFTQRRQSTGVPLKETKMILVGQGEVGKTSLVKHLRGERVDTHESATQGIRVEPWQPGAVADDVKVRIWDFGGQEIMHATHQFFLTERTLYLVVLNSREDEHRGRLEYWLKLIQNFAAGAPTLIVCNKADQHRLDLDERGLRQKYPFILGVHRVSAVTGLGMDELTSAIGAAIRDLQHLQERFLPAEIAVKEKLEAPGGDYISYERYQQVCDEAGMPKDIRRKTLLRFLNDLGVVLSFVDDPQMMMTSVLRPDWVTDGVYAVLHAHMDGGVLHHAQLSEILKPSERYPEDKHGFIIEMMKKFELCFQYDTADRKTRYLIPDLLPKNEPDTGDWEGALRFEYQYEVLPSSIISRFIVRMQAMISKRTYWRTGVVLERNRNRALVKADLEEKRIRIAVDGNVMGRRELLDIIRAEFEQLHSTISQIAVKEKVPLPDAPGVLADYQHLRTLRDMFTLNFVPEGATRTYNVRHLLEGVDTEERMMASNRDKLAPLEREDPPPQRVAPPVSVAQVWGMGGFVLLAFAVVAVILIAGMQFAGALGFGLLALGILLSVALVLVIVLRMTGAINEARLERMTGGLLERLPLLRGGRDQTGSAPAPQQKPKRPRRTTPPA